LVLPLFASSPADAHGAPTRPGSRTYLCRIDGTSTSGDIEPHNPACAAAVAMSGKQPLWDWFGVLRGDGAGRTRGYIPDGQLCSGGEPKFAGYDLARADWPSTSLTAGADLTFRYNAWAAHPGQFRMYITKDGYDPTEPLAWDDLEAEPFSVYDQNQPNGTDEQNGSPDYQWTARLPQKSGQHIIYSVWERSDSAETFYGCSDVRFDGGSGQVLGVGPGANPVGDPGPGGPATSIAPDPGPSTSIPTGDAGQPGSAMNEGADGGTVGTDGAGTDASTEATTPGGQSGTGQAATGTATATATEDPSGIGTGQTGADGATGQPAPSVAGQSAATADDRQPDAGQVGASGQAASTDQGPASTAEEALSDRPEASPSSSPSDGGIGRWGAIFIGLGGAVIGAGASAAHHASLQSRSWEARRRDHERVQPPWDRIDEPAGQPQAPFRPLTTEPEIISASRN